MRLATRLCVAPIALVSLVAANRQWFKARVGFPRCETDLDHSVCAYALAERPPGRGTVSITQRLPSTCPSGVRSGAPA